MSFDLYFAGIQALELDEYLSSKNCHRLFSYADKPKKRLQMFHDCQSKIFMDSGAYGVAHSGKEITLDEYINFINETPRVNLFACLDVIPWPTLTVETSNQSAEQSWNNYVYMIEKVKPEYRDKIVPTYHYGENFKYLRRMLQGHEGYKPPYIAFGGRGGVHTNKLYESLTEFFNVIKQERPDVKTHAFGITVLKLLETYPFTSADSTSWIMIGANGNILTPFGLVTVSDSQQHLKNHISNNLGEKQLNKYLQSIGIELELVRTDYKYRMLVNLIYLKNWADNYVYKGSSINRKKLF